MAEDRLIYYREQSIEENNVIELRFTQGADIEEFKQLCATLAHFVGYHDDNIVEAFGISPTSSEFKLQLQVLEYKK